MNILSNKSRVTPIKDDKPYILFLKSSQATQAQAVKLGKLLHELNVDNIVVARLNDTSK